MEQTSLAYFYYCFKDAALSDHTVRAKCSCVMSNRPNSVVQNVLTTSKKITEPFEVNANAISMATRECYPSTVTVTSTCTEYSELAHLCGPEDCDSSYLGKF